MPDPADHHVDPPADPPARSDVTVVLEAAAAGDPSAEARLLPLLYDELRKLAGSMMARQRPGNTLQATALVHEALRKLEAEDPDVAHVVMLRYFAGLTVEETAEVLALSAPTIKRRGRYARAWLQKAMGAAGSDDEP